MLASNVIFLKEISVSLFPISSISSNPGNEGLTALYYDFMKAMRSSEYWILKNS